MGGMRIDSHVHIFPPEVVKDRERYLSRDLGFRTLYANPRAKMAGVDELLAAMDGAGIDMAVMVNIGWSDTGLCRSSHDFLLDAARRHPGRLIAFCAVNPAEGDRAAREAQRCAGLGARGIGELHPDFQGYSLADAAIMGPVMEAAGQYGMPVLSHSSEPVGHSYTGKGTATPDILYRFVSSFPNADIILAHWGGGIPFYGLMPEVRKALANVYFDSAASPFLYDAAVFERVASLAGPEKILFGTDYPLVQPDRLLGQVMEADLSAHARELILGGNAARLLRLKDPGT